MPQKHWRVRLSELFKECYDADKQQWIANASYWEFIGLWTWHAPELMRDLGRYETMDVF